MTMRSRAPALALAATLLLAPASLQAQEGWNLPIDRDRMIRAGETRSSSLEGGDRALGDGSFFEAWFFEGRAGQRVTITMRSGGFDTFLAVGRHNGDVIESNDDEGEGSSTDSKLSITLPADGMYVIRANSLEAGKSGEYRISLEAGAASDEGGSGSGASVEGGTLSGADVLGEPVNRTRMLQSGQEVNGALDASDRKLSDNSYFDVYYVALAAGQQVTVTMRSGAFDTYLSIGAHGASEAAETNDDIEEGNTDSRVIYTAPSAGTYVIIANSLESGQTGAYTLQAVVSGGESRQLTLGQTATSDLGSDDQKLEDDSFYELWVFQGEAGSRVTITMRSGDFDAYLTIRDASGESIGSDDDTGGGTDAQVTVTIPSNGRIAIVANSLGEGETGRYTLQIVRAN